MFMFISVGLAVTVGHAVTVGLAVTNVWKHIHRLSVILLNGFILTKLSGALPKTE